MTYRIENVNEIDNPDIRAANPAVFGQPVPVTLKQPAPGKYRAVKTEHNGIVYHSKKEAKKAVELDLQVKAGDIDFYLRQVPFTLPGGIVYRADFVTFRQTYGQAQEDDVVFDVQVIEVKGFETPAWKMKLKLFRTTYPNLTIEVC